MTDRSHYEGWTHEVWLRCRFEETARWLRIPTMMRTFSNMMVRSVPT